MLMQNGNRWLADLVFIQFLVNEFIFSLLLEGDDNEGDEDVNEEEREDDEVDDVKNGHVHAMSRLGAFIHLCCLDGMPQDPKDEHVGELVAGWVNGWMGEWMDG